MSDVVSLSQSALVATTLNNLIIVTPNKNIGIQPQNKKTNSGDITSQQDPIIFNYEGENSVSFTSDITDHFIEDNTAIQDQIAIKPIIITTSGYIGELNDIVPEDLKLLKEIANRLTIVSALTPEASITAQIAYNSAKTTYDIEKLLSEGEIAKWGKQPNKTKQQIAFEKFYGYWSNRTLFTVQTPWAIFEDCAIMSLRTTQSDSSNSVTDFEVSFKPLKFATTKRLSADQQAIINSLAPNGRALEQAFPERNLGPNPVNPSISFEDGVSLV